MFAAISASAASIVLCSGLPRMLHFVCRNGLIRCISIIALFISFMMKSMIFVTDLMIIMSFIWKNAKLKGVAFMCRSVVAQTVLCWVRTVPKRRLFSALLLYHIHYVSKVLQRCIPDRRPLQTYQGAKRLSFIYIFHYSTIYFLI